MQTHRFSIPVNCSMPDDSVVSDKVQDFEKIYEDSGFIILPDSYTESGAPTRLVINCHGAGGTVTTNDSQVEHQVLTQYLVANGYAVMDANGLPEEFAKEHNIDIRNNIGSPIALRSYVKAYHYCMDRFNLKPGVFVHGGSMGGISSTNLVLSGCIPVIAHSAHCPVLDTYNEIFLHPWSKGLSKEALSRIYKFEKDENGEYIYDENKLCGYNPVRNLKAKAYPVPVKFWHCTDDIVVSCDITKDFVRQIRENGGNASLRILSSGGHNPQTAGESVANPCGNTEFCGTKLEITPALEETFIWIRNFD
ncbi:MAG: hypothetical protein IKY62_01020 [Clostridia bacterium]|nr:hypothetical protein [Clostridia bacterium]